MNDIIFVSCILVAAAYLSRLTINPKTYSRIKWCLFLVASILLLLILNVEAVSSVSNQIAQSLNALGIGYPRSWVLKTRQYDDVISGCYYVTYFSTWLTLIITATYEHKGMAEMRGRDSILNWAGVLLFVLVLWIVFGADSTFNGMTGRVVRAAFNSQIGLIINQYATVNVIGLLVGLCIRAIFSKNHSTSSK